MDRIRALWDGEKKKFIVRKGGIKEQIFEVTPPSSFSSFLPLGDHVLLDGELIREGMSGDDAVLDFIVDNKKDDLQADWTDIYFYAFDVPDLRHQILSERIKKLEEYKTTKHFKVAEYRICTGNVDLWNSMLLGFQQGKEGLLLHSPSSLYTPGRTDALQKVNIYCLQPALVKQVHPKASTIEMLDCEGQTLTYKIINSWKNAILPSSVVQIKFRGFTEKQKLKDYSIRLSSNISWNSVSFLLTLSLPW
eukprot:TRINITY_DN24111_c0_g1_i1.p1 TRINITY_DN24111_c0_g1~~TRINITY_DN24111_c0_g1_i1.p1  ORF type:complete len:249 (+),score=63.25 TRINITY_DN24111_c0_g1_i1:168-914(+)